MLRTTVGMAAHVAARHAAVVRTGSGHVEPDEHPVQAARREARGELGIDAGNLAVTGVDQLLAIIKNRLKSIQHRNDLLDGLLTHTGMTLELDTT
ncbi:NUDIX hydrolase [Micromonospora zhanjiangensis]|uniref:NUDIX hydrolase n=1 Tax=Micromonospora zhanjiangensis TaxID=1522057 RepID=A0ABV8KHT0_9ACTN